MRIDIRLTGDKELERKLHNLEEKTEKKIVRGAIRKAAVQAKNQIVQNIVGAGLVDSGVMLAAYKAAKIKSAGKPGLIRYGPENPPREALGIHAQDPYYYPYAVEFGHGNVRPHPFIRPAIDNHKNQIRAAIAQDIATGIMKEALK